MVYMYYIVLGLTFAKSIVTTDRNYRSTGIKILNIRNLVRTSLQRTITKPEIRPRHLDRHVPTQ